MPWNGAEIHIPAGLRDRDRQCDRLAWLKKRCLFAVDLEVVGKVTNIPFRLGVRRAANLYADIGIVKLRRNYFSMSYRRYTRCSMSQSLSQSFRPLPLAQPRVITETRNVTLEVFKALADPIRLELLAHIAARGPLCVCHLEEAVPYSQSRISKHLGVLRRAGLVSTRRDRNWVYYSVDTEALEAARDFVDQLERSMALPHASEYCEPSAEAPSA
jgi:DNA-binding transcriptional ArsR family regulator